MIQTEFYNPKGKRKTVTGRYEVDEFGHVYSNGFEMSLIDGRYVNLYIDGTMCKVKVAYLVARAFVPNMEMRPYLVHKDGDTRNNRADNLEWSEVKEKVRPTRGETKPRKVACMDKDGEVRVFSSIWEASGKTALERRGIRRCLEGKQKKCGGLKWFEV